MAVTETWECETCGWTCAPNPYLALDDAECDNCGDPLTLAGDRDKECVERNRDA